jgi:hypothetical protein
VSELKQCGVAGRPGAGRWRLLVPRLRRKFTAAVRGQAAVLELSYADYLGHLRVERHSCPPLGPPKPPLEPAGDRTG